MTFGIFRAQKTDPFRAYFPPPNSVDVEAMDTKYPIDCYQVRFQDVVFDILSRDTVPNLKKLAEDSGMKVGRSKMELVETITKVLCDCSDAPCDPVRGFDEAIKKLKTLDMKDRVIFSLWMARLSSADLDYEDIIVASEVINAKASQDLKNFMIWFAPFQPTISLQSLMEVMGKYDEKVVKHAFLGKEEDKAFPTKKCQVAFDMEKTKVLICFEVGMSATGADMYEFFENAGELEEGAFSVKWSSHEGASTLQRYDTLFSYIENDDMVWHLDINVKGGGVHTKLKKNMKLEQQKQEFAKKSEKAIGGIMAEDLLQKTEKACATMLSDTSGDFMKNLLFKKSITELQDMKVAFQKKTSGKVMRQMTGDFLSIHKELTVAKEKIALAIDALESAFGVQLIQCFYSDENQRFHYPSVAMIDTIIQLKSAGEMPTEQRAMAD